VGQFFGQDFFSTRWTERWLTGALFPSYSGLDKSQEYTGTGLLFFGYPSSCPANGIIALKEQHKLCTVGEKLLFYAWS